MAQFDQSKAYASQEDVYFDDGREAELLHYVQGRRDVDEIRGDPARVLQAIDEYGRTKKYLMNVELGGYVGYSCILFGDALRRAGGNRYWTLEKSPEFVEIIRSFVDLAGLGDVVRVVVGTSSESLLRLNKQGDIVQADMMFLDHIKPAYLPDLKLCEGLGIVGPGTILAADNVIKPGNPPYLKYVRSTVEEKRKAAAEQQDISGKSEGVSSDGGDREKSYYVEEDGEGNQVELAARLKGDPDLVYKSELHESFEPTGIPDGVEVTYCLGRARAK